MREVWLVSSIMLANANYSMHVLASEYLRIGAIEL